MQERPVHGPDPHVSGHLSRHRRRRANVYSYTMDVDGLKLSASPAILEFEAVGDGTKAHSHELGAFPRCQQRPG